MSTPRGFRDRSDDGLLTLLGEVPELVRNLVVAEITSAKKWAASAGKDVGMGSVGVLVALLGAVIFAFLGLARFRHLSRSENPAKAAATDTRIVKDVIDEF